MRSPIRALLSAGMNKPRRNRLKAAAAAFASNAVNGNLRRAQLSFLGAWTAEWAFTVALGIVAYRDGGATAVGLVGLLRMVPSAVVAPLAAPLADRGRRERVLVVVSTVRGIATGAAGIVVAIGDDYKNFLFLLALLFQVVDRHPYRVAHGRSAARIDSATISPVAISVTSPPSINWIALPIVNVWSVP